MVIPLPCGYESKGTTPLNTRFTDMRLALALLISACLMAGPASAQLVTDGLDGDRYLIVEVEDGVLRIDRQSGDISECQESPMAGFAV
jgi:hypothetical protein